MGNTLSSRNGSLIFNDCLIEEPLPFISKPNQFVEGDLSVVASEKNILALAQSCMKLFITRKRVDKNAYQNAAAGFKAPEGEIDWVYPTLDVGRKYFKIPPEKQISAYQRRHFRTIENITCGWCYLIAGTLHRFLYKEFDMYKLETGLDAKGRQDSHWWLMNDKGDIIDLTYEQFIHGGTSSTWSLERFRKDGYQPKSLFTGGSTMKKTRNMAYFVANLFEHSAVKFDLIKISSYWKP